MDMYEGNNKVSIESSQVMNDEEQILKSKPGFGGLLEIEEEPPLRTHYTPVINRRSQTAHRHGSTEEDLLDLGSEPIRTSSGLHLTHRRTPMLPRRQQQQHRRSSQSDNLETEFWYSIRGAMSGTPSRSSGGLTKAKRLLAFAQLWVLVFCGFLLVGTVVAIRSIRHERTGEKQANDVNSPKTNINTVDQQLMAEKIILRPLKNLSELESIAEPQKMTLETPNSNKHGARRALRQLRDEFEAWMEEHKKTYKSEDEKEKRFEVWSHNHHKTIEKNKRHGNCKMLKTPVFGSNEFKDLTTQEFQAQFLTGYKGPTTDNIEAKRYGKEEENQDNSERKEFPNMRRTSEDRVKVLDPSANVDRHPDVQKRVLQSWGTSTATKQNLYDAPVYNANGNCGFSISCWVRWVFNTYGYGIIGTLEPAFDSDTYPDAVDWRQAGVVGQVDSQGNCGACWAITAVETVESAYAISKGTLYNLAETEVIACDDSCEMCNGGWPQNAYDYVMENNGLPLESDLSYDGDYLLEVTYAIEGQSDYLSSDDLEYYFQNTCPNGRGSGSGDGDGGGSRYGNIKGYGYATERCVCYTDGTGCDCDEQNEMVALQNVATYGPATVCLEASLWQDYAGGIITSSLGCGSGFLDMNHCVQAVGYAFYDVNDQEDYDEDGSNSKDSGGSKDDGSREGYWIIRNQWSSNWGMNGYAYVAMGENTCGVLNDMTVAYA